MSTVPGPMPSVTFGSPIQLAAENDAMERGSEEKINIALIDELSGLSKLQIRQVQLVLYV